MPSVPHVGFYFQRSSLDTRCETNPPFLGECVGQRGRMDVSFHWTAVDELFVGFVSFSHLACSSVVFLVRNKWQLPWRHRTQSSPRCPLLSHFWIVDCLKSSQPDSKDVDSQALPLGDYCICALASGLSHCHFQRDTGEVNTGLAEGLTTFHLERNHREIFI